MVDVYQVEQIVKRMLGSISAPVMAQLNGGVVSDGHRVLNFMGAGVAVSDDPAQRRVNVIIPGATVTSTATTVASSTSAKAHSLWNGSSNDTPPSGWETPGFNDSGWSAAVVTTTGPGFDLSLFTPANPIWSTTGPPSGNPVESILVRHTFTLPPGTILSATLRLTADSDADAIYINGTSVGSHGTTAWSTPVPGHDFSISPSLLTPNASNVLAVEATNSLLSNNTAGLVYRLTVTYSVTVARSIVLAVDQKSQNTSGGTITSGAWRTRTLNTLRSDGGGTASLSSNQISLPAGTYSCSISVPGQGCDRHQARLQNVTDSSTVSVGTSEYSPNTQTQSRSHIRDVFTIGAGKLLEVQHQVQTTGSSNSGGVPSNFGAEIYSMAEFVKES